MPSSFDRAPQSIDRKQPEGFFELPPRALRKRFPFVQHDPAFAQESLAAPDNAKNLASAGFEALDVDQDGPEIALRLVLHLGMREPNVRRRCYELLQQTPPVDLEQRAIHELIRRAAAEVSGKDKQPLPENYPPDYKPAWRELRRLRPLTGIKIIDYGAASGGFVELLRALGALAYGVDLSKELVSLANQGTLGQHGLFTEKGLELLVASREYFFREDILRFFSGTDIVLSNRLMRVVNAAPQHRQFMDVVTSDILKPGGLVITTPSLLDNGERLDDEAHYGQRYSQYDYVGDDEVWSYTIARKLK